MGLPYDGRPFFCSEFGGIGWGGDDDLGHAWGYGQGPRTVDEFLRRFEGLVSALRRTS